MNSTANATTSDEIDDDPRPCRYDENKHLICQRHDSGDPQQRRELSKRIYRLARKHAREYYTAQTRQVLESFKDLR